MSGTDSSLPRSSAPGRFLRRLADFLDRSAPSRGSTREIRVLGAFLVFAGLITAGTVIHGWHFLFWNFLFASFFCTGSWLIFSSVAWPAAARAFLLAVLLIASISAAADRLLGIGAFILLLLALLRSLAQRREDVLRANGVNVLAVILLCLAGYGFFSAILEWRRSAALAIDHELSMSCRNDRCLGADVAFTVPEFWHRGSGTALVTDLEAVLPLRVYRDTATDNAIAFAAFRQSPEQLMQQVTNFLYVQKGFLRSWNVAGSAGVRVALVPQQMMRASDAQLYALRYSFAAQPGYLGSNEESTALLLLHQRRGTTWFFMIDGGEIGAREFLLHRIISGFH